MNLLKSVLYATTFACVVSVGSSSAQKSAAPVTPARYVASTEWPTYGHDSGGMRFSPLKQITPANVGTLQIAWVYHMKPEGYVAPTRTGRGGAAGGRGGAAGGRGAEASGRAGAAPEQGRGRGSTGFNSSEVTPLVVGSLMYVSTPYGRVVALNPATGKEVWVYQLPGGNPSTRGVEYFAGDAHTPPLIVVGTSESKLFTLDPKTGALNTTFGDSGFVTLDKPPTSPSIVYKNLIIIGGRLGEGSGPGKSGDVVAYDIHNGKLAWTFHSIPQPGEPNYGTSWFGDSAKQRTGVNVWGFMTVDIQRGIVYMPFGAVSGDQFGGDRPGDNLYSTSIVAADANTGKYLWHFQVVHHDIFDDDLAAPPLLMDVKQGGTTIPSVAVVGKNGLLFLLDRVTGKPIYGVEERPVAQSDVPGEKTSPTQPFPIKPAPVSRIDFTMDDIATVTPELEAACRKLIVDNNIAIGNGPYAPLTYNRSRVIFPSMIGGSNWGGMSFDPTLGYLFMNVSNWGQLGGVRDPDSGPVDLATLAGTNLPGGRTGPYANVSPSGRFRDEASGLPCNQPPWGEMVAVNVHTGDIAWKVALGVTDSLPAGKQNTGRPNIGGSIATASGLLFIGATDDSRFRALNAKTGKELWVVKLSASSAAVPITYQAADGKQYVVVAATGAYGGATLADEITAFTVK